MSDFLNSLELPEIPLSPTEVEVAGIRDGRLYVSKNFTTTQPKWESILLSDLGITGTLQNVTVDNGCCTIITDSGSWLLSNIFDDLIVEFID